MNTCTICGHGLTGNRALWTTCQTCQTRLEADLLGIENDWPKLSDALEPTRGHSGPRVSGTPEWSPPIVGKVIDLIGPLGIPTQLYHRYADLALARRIQPATMPPGADARVRLALYGIRKHLPWAVQGMDLTGFQRDIARMHQDLCDVIGPPDDAPRVPCPAQLPDGERCTGRMRYDRDRKTAACRTCGTDLKPAEWLEYWVKLGQPA